MSVLTQGSRLLAADEPSPFRTAASRLGSPYLIACDHAGRRLPRVLGNLGVSAADLETHIAWDIGAAGVATHLATALDGWLITQTYSRLVIDCNRPLGVSDSIPVRSAQVSIAGNEGVTAGEAERRAEEIFHPYHAQIRNELDERQQKGLPAIFIAIHSFTPSLLGAHRPWHVGVLYRHPALARPLLDLLHQEEDLVVGDNEPYSVGDLTDYSVVEHGERRGVPHVELEIRQDLIADEAGQLSWAARFARLIPQASARYRP